VSTYIGIDPGKNGGIAWITALTERTISVHAEKMPATMRDLWSLIAFYGGTDEHATAIVEKLGQMPRKNGKALQSPSSTGKLYRNYGHIEMALTAAGIPFDEIIPAKWQQPFGLIRKNKSESQTAKKNRHKEKAQQLFPNIKVIHAIADALLLAETCRRMA
jgi:hypothetical protein